jgi:5-methylcytosine-specific restriction endonuclease McrBC GTP-binding regulatory subunit McrB
MNLVSENMDQFRRGQDSKPALDIGMKTKIEKWLNENGFNRYEILEDSTIDLQQSLDMQNGEYLDKPEFIDFEYVRGYMNITNNPGLRTLEGCPIKVGGFFHANDCDLDSLIGAPEYIGANFNVSNNALSSLEGFPKEVMGWVSIGDNPVEFTEEEIRAVCNVKGKVLTKVSHLFDSWIYR